jgi:hypothetical protein
MKVLNGKKKAQFLIRNYNNEKKQIYMDKLVKQLSEITKNENQ